MINKIGLMPMARSHQQKAVSFKSNEQPEKIEKTQIPDLTQSDNLFATGDFFTKKLNDIGLKPEKEIGLIPSSDLFSYRNFTVFLADGFVLLYNKLVNVTKENQELKEKCEKYRTQLGYGLDMDDR